MEREGAAVTCDESVPQTSGYDRKCSSIADGGQMQLFYAESSGVF